MKTRLLKLWDDLSGSYWFLPSVFIIGGIICSLTLPEVDALVDEEVLPKWIRTTQASARTNLSTIMAAMISVAGTVFSITMVTLSLTSQQFGPRLLRNFMLNNVTQVTLGMFLGTSVYSCLMLQILDDKHAFNSLPNIAVFTATIMMIICLFMLIVYFHHIALLIQAPRVVEQIAHEMDAAIDRLFESPDQKAETRYDNKTFYLNAESEQCEYILSNQEGYIQAIDLPNVLHFAEHNQVLVQLLVRPGDFVCCDSRIALLQGDEVPEEDATTSLNSTIIVGMRRTPRQDLCCSVNEMVEIAVRSLSPGINDPFTALTCVDRLGASMLKLTKKSSDAPTLYANERALVHKKTLTFAEVFENAFLPLLDYSKDARIVNERLVKVMEELQEHTCCRDAKDMLTSLLNILNKNLDSLS